MLNRLHMVIVGASGAGKSTLLRELAAKEIAAGRGLLLIDPHGDLADEVLTGVPRRRKNDIVNIDALNPEGAPGLNPLRNVSPANRALVTSHVLSAFKRLSGTSWGFRTEHILRAAVLAVLETRAPTLADVERMLFDAQHRQWILSQVRDERVARFWSIEYAAYGRMAGEAAAAPSNKLASLLAVPNVRALLVKNRPRFDARRALDAQRIVVASLPKGRLGEEVTVLGTFLLAAFQTAAMSRADIPLSERKSFTIIVDELSSFILGPMLEMLAECRKFGIRLVLATQSIAILPPETRAALLSNAGHLVAFRVMAADAELLAAELVRYGPATLTALSTGERVERLAGRQAQIVSPPLTSSSADDD